MFGAERSLGTNKSYCSLVKERAKTNTMSIIFAAICIVALGCLLAAVKTMNIPKSTSIKAILPFFISTIVVGLFVASNTLGMCGIIFFNRQTVIKKQQEDIIDDATT